MWDLTKFGYITKIKKNNWKLYTNSSYIMPNFSKLKKSNATKIFWFKVEGWYFQIPTENVMYFAQPIKAYVIDQSLNEFIVMSYYLIPPINHHQLTELISFHNFNDRQRLANQKPNTNSITSQVECLQCRNSKSFRQKLHSYLSFHTVYELETLRAYLYSPSLRTGIVLSKFEFWPKIWVENV